MGELLQDFAGSRAHVEGIRDGIHHATSQSGLVGDMGQFHNSVGTCLEKLGVAYENEKQIKGLWCDIALVDEKTILEIDGPSHFLFGLDTQEFYYDGVSRGKAAFLRAIGYKVVRIAYFEWEALDRTDISSRIECVRRKLC